MIAAVETLPQALLSSGLNFAQMLQLARVIRESGERAARVIAALRRYVHKEESGHPQPTDVAATLEECFVLLRNRMKQGVALHFDPAERPLAMGMPDRLVQVWTNLLNNAGHSIRWAGRIEVRLSRCGEGVRVDIQDDGPGIDPSIRDRLFKPFVTTKPRGEGTGLGLSIVDTLLRDMGGSIVWESEPGRTVFSVFLAESSGDPEAPKA